MELKNKFILDIRTKGYSFVEDVFDEDVVKQLRSDLEKAIHTEAEYHKTTDYQDYGVVQLCPLYGRSFLEVFENNDFVSPYNWIMGKGSIVYVYISSSLPPNGLNRATRIHVDRPKVFGDYVEALAGLVLLDDFTAENGGTILLPGSQNQQEEPSEEDFYKDAVQITGKAGSVLYFNMRLWHTAGVNKTDHWRHAIAIGAVPPYYKQKFDIPRALEKINADISDLSEAALQKLGYHAIPPTSLDEFYVPEKRTYRQKSEWEDYN